MASLKCVGERSGDITSTFLQMMSFYSLRRRHLKVVFSAILSMSSVGVPVFKSIPLPVQVMLGKPGEFNKA